jgi:hypothetical protein
VRFVASFAGAFATPAVPGAAVADERGTARELRRIAALPRRTRLRLLRRQGREFRRFERGFRLASVLTVFLPP